MAQHGRRTCWWMLLVFLLCSTSSATSSSPNGSSSKVVTHLPGFEGPLPFHLETGYVEVDGSNGARLFYYFFRSERSPADDPLMLWLTGGPYCSVVSAIAYENGPFSFDVNDHADGLPKLLYNQDSWTKMSNIIFLDSPVGAGFSYSDTEQGYKSSDTKAVNQILIFLRKWFDEHPEFLSNPLYIAGDSYSGMIVPTVTSGIVRGIEVGRELAHNLKGYLVGNPVTDDNFDGPAKYPFAHGMGLISDEMFEEYRKSCSTGGNSHQSVECTNCLDAIDESVKDIYTNHILEPLCTFSSPHPYKLKLNSSAREMLQLNSELHLSEISSKCRVRQNPLSLFFFVCNITSFQHFKIIRPFFSWQTAQYLKSSTWANDARVREALGIHKGTVPSWVRCNYDIRDNYYTFDIQSAVKYNLDVTTKGYKSLIFSGDHDMIVPFIGTQAWIRSLNFSIVDKWRPWYVDGQVAGYTRSYSNNLTFATVKGGGHTAVEYMPRQCFVMLERWIAGEHL